MLAHTRTGAGDPIVLVHGITHRRQGWRTVAPLLEDRFEVIAVDLPDHGDSAELTPDYRGDIGPLADALEEFLAGIRVERPHLVGNSLGGLLALELGARRAARSVTALSPAGFWSPAERVRARAMLGGASGAFRRMPATAFRKALEYPAGRKALLGAVMEHPEGHATDDLVDDLRGLTHPRASFPVMLGALGEWALSGPIAVPVVVGWGTHDRILPIGQYRRLLEVLPEAEVYSLPGCGHVPMGDDPQAVADLIRYTASR